ncbi:MAG: ACP S-malonyltransferase [Bacteroidota bacterium]
MKPTLLFPGQGSQYKGMGKALFPKYLKEVQSASEILGYDIEELCVKDPNRQLAKTQYTQPALYVVNHLQYQEIDLKPHYVIGHSLGEYNALLVAGAFDFETGLRLVQKRGELMAAASGGSMAAVLGLNIDALKNKLKEGGYNDLDIANYNTPTQTVLSGPQASIDQICKDFDAQKIKIIPLFVTAPFHSRYMEAASKEFATFLQDFTLKDPQLVVIANATARSYGTGQVADLLSRQIAGSVQWTDTIRYLMGQGVTEYREVGRDILTKMVDEIRKDCTPIKAKGSTAAKSSAKNKKKTQASSSATFTSSKTISNGTNGKTSGSLNNGTSLPLARRLGSAAFREDYGVNYSYIAGAMYRGTASKELVIAMGKAGMIGYLGTAGLSLEQVSSDIDAIQAALSEGQAYGMNLLHHLGDPDFEMQTVELYLKKGVQNVEAAAYMQMSESLVYFLASGIEKRSDGSFTNRHRVLAKVSRPEVAEAFMRPAPERLLNALLDQGRLTPEQVEGVRKRPISYDICVEADSGGHTDGGVALVLLPSIQRLRDDLQKEYGYPETIRTGLAGGIGAPSSAASAFVMGADFILTGSINQCTVEAGTSDAVKDLLEAINVQDTDYAPAGDMFEIGARVQVLKKGVLFPARANKLYSLYNQYNALEEIPEKTIIQLERNYFKKSLAEIWEETKTYFRKIGKPEEITKAEQTPRHKMALVFRWYFGYSSRVAFAGDMDHKVNYQVHTGPALGAFNQWVKGTELESWRNRHVDKIGKKLMEATAELLEATMAQLNKDALEVDAL